MLERQTTGVRDLRSAFVEQATAASGPETHRVLLAVVAPMITATRLREEWERFARVLRPAVSERLAFAAVARKGTVIDPAEDLTEVAASLLGRVADQLPQRSRTFVWDRKRFDVFASLLDAWLGHEPPMPISELTGRAGVSYPTVSVTLKALAERNEVLRTTSRSAALAGLPRRALEELVPRLTELRETHFYEDASGRDASAESLLTRLQRKPVLGVHLGGVSAAREYWPGFNLNGLPRLDLTAHGDAPPDWLHRLDPALRRVPPSSSRIILAVHHARHRRDVAGPRARRADVAFDLYSLGLGQQAEEFIRHFRP